MAIQVAYLHEGQEIPAEALAEIEAADRLPIDFTDIPEISQEEIDIIDKLYKHRKRNDIPA